MAKVMCGEQFPFDESRFHLSGGPHDEFVWVSRVKFLDAIKRLAPEVLLDLKATVLPELQKLEPDAGYLHNIPAGDYVRLLRNRGLKDELIHPWRVGLWSRASTVVAWPTFHAVAEELCAELMPTVEKLKSWAERYCLTHVEGPTGLRIAPEWILNAAWGTLSVWDREPALKQAMSWHPPGLMLPPLEAAHGRWELVLHLPSYNPLVESWEEYERRVRSRVSSSSRHLLEGHKRKIEHELRNWKRMPNKWQKHHFEWLVYFQIKAHSPGQIADGCKTPVTEIAVLKGVHLAAGIMGLTPRPGKRGRGSIRNMNSPKIF